MPETLWDYALRFYRQPAIEATCLELQERGQDVCLLITLSWLEQRHIGYREAYLHALTVLAGDWQKRVITPLRHMRRAWKEPSQTDATLARLRDQIKQLELQAEQALLGRLEDKTRDWEAATATADWLDRLPGLEAHEKSRLRHAAQASHRA